jgi:L-ascorbate metabolism protein UlaG (beta-lactamase superfamily)
MAHIEAYLKDEALVKDMDAHLDEHQGFRAWWLGQSGFLIQYNGERILLDPYLSDSLSRKYAGTDKPHVRISERVIDPSLLKGISIVSSSHNHTDHLDAETLQPILDNNPGIRFVIPEANRKFVAERVGCAIEYPDGLNDGHSLAIDRYTFHGIPAKHNEIDRDEKGNCRYMGYVVRFGDFAIYHSGDTLHFDGMEEMLRPFQVDIAFLPINGNDPARRVAGNLDGKESAELAKAIGAKLVIPCHYDMFAFNTADPADFVYHCERLGQPFRVLRLGEGLSIEDRGSRINDH